jgi:signal transduction histidine kinase
MNDPGKLPPEVAAVIDAWRRKALGRVLSLAALLAVPAMAIMLSSKVVTMPVAGRVASLGIFLLVLLAWWRNDWSLRTRALLLLGACYSMTALKLVITGLVGSGRNGLILLPLFALILAGNRVGWLALATSVGMFGVFSALAGGGVLAPWLLIPSNTTDAGFWLVQGLLWLVLLAPLMVLLSRLLTLHTRVMIDEHRARRAIEAAAAEQRRLEETLTQISEQERTRIGAELHDGLCQQLTAALLTCTALEMQLSARGASEMNATHRLRQSLEECIGSAYAAAKGLCPVGLTSESLAPALEQLSHQTRQEAGIACELRRAGDPPQLAPGATLHLYRIAQEAVHNAVKHSSCQHIFLELREETGAFTLRVSDDGKPSAGATRSSVGGLGTQIMTYRANVIGGTLWIEHPAAGGTVVNCRLPSQSPKAMPSSTKHDTDTKLHFLDDTKARAHLPG